MEHSKQKASSSTSSSVDSSEDREKQDIFSSTAKKYSEFHPQEKSSQFSMTPRSHSFLRGNSTPNRGVADNLGQFPGSNSPICQYEPGNIRSHRKSNSGRPLRPLSSTFCTSTGPSSSSMGPYDAHQGTPVWEMAAGYESPRAGQMLGASKSGKGKSRERMTADSLQQALQDPSSDLYNLPTPSFRCCICNMEFETEKESEHHLQQFHFKPVKCPNCGYRCSSREHLERHNREHQPGHIKYFDE